MSIVVRFSPTALTAKKYDETIRQIENAGEWPPAGLDYHVCFGSDGNLKVSETWNSREQFEAFGERLMPILACPASSSPIRRTSSRFTTSSSADHRARRPDRESSIVRAATASTSPTSQDSRRCCIAKPRRRSFTTLASRERCWAACPFRVLTIVDQWSRQSPILEVAASRRAPRSARPWIACCRWGRRCARSPLITAPSSCRGYSRTGPTSVACSLISSGPGIS